MQVVRVIGVPRSGTNLAKYLLESQTTLRCVFNHGWWKHAVVPPLFADGAPAIDATPTLILYREPMDQMQAFFRFSEKGRAAIYGDAPLDAFLRNPVRSDPPGGYALWYPSPGAYWEQFYEAALQWDHPGKYFLSLDDVRADPNILARVAEAIAPGASAGAAMALPAAYLGRNGDAHVSESFGFEAGADRAGEEAEADALRARFSASDRAFVLTDHAVSVHGRLEQIRFR